ncbi:MAG: hypothetical protein ACR2QB_06925 [Gammaproteobacteria bacterium]
MALPATQGMQVSARRITRYAVRQSRRLRANKKRNAWLLSLLLVFAWLVGSAVFSVNGIYNLFRLLQLRPVYWLSYATVATAAQTRRISGLVCKALGRLATRGWPGCQRPCGCAG